jgi:hypothetical protein
MSSKGYKTNLEREVKMKKMVLFVAALPQSHIPK